MSELEKLISWQRLWPMAALALGCATARPAGEAPVVPVTPGNESAAAQLVDCQSAVEADELLVYCPEVMFGIKDLPRANAEDVFRSFVEELRKRPDGPVEVVEFTRAMNWGPAFPAASLRIHKPGTPAEDSNVVLVTAGEVGGKTRRAWCVFGDTEPAGLVRCQEQLPLFLSGPLY